MNIANVKGLAVKGTLGAMALGAFFFAGTAKAQGFAVGVQFGAPAYVAPAGAYYAEPGYYAGDARRDAYLRHEEREAMERREAIIRREQWERARAFDQRFDRDRHFDRDDRHWR